MNHKHKFREYTLDPIRGHVTQIFGSDCDLFSGLQDCTGTDIFENDLLEDVNGNRFPAVFSKGEFTVDLQPLKYCNTKYRVIGHT